MPVFAYTIAADQERPSEGEGFIRAETIQQAVALVGHPEVNVYPLPSAYALSMFRMFCHVLNCSYIRRT